MIGGRRRRWPTSGPAVLAAISVLGAAACAGTEDSSDTLAPLPISLNLPPSSTATSAGSITSAPPTTTGTFASGSTTAVTGEATLVGDWDGAEYDVGVIAEVGALGGYQTIEFDRYSFRDPERGVIDAGAFVEEPIAYGWTESPFVNIQEQLRTFVLADDVEVLLLGGAAAGRSCRDRRPLPSADWVDVGVSYLDQPAATDDVASLTYTEDGQVTRIRFTRGCVGSS